MLPHGLRAWKPSGRYENSGVNLCVNYPETNRPESVLLHFISESIGGWPLWALISGRVAPDLQGDTPHVAVWIGQMAALTVVPASAVNQP